MWRTPQWSSKSNEITNAPYPGVISWEYYPEVAQAVRPKVEWIKGYGYRMSFDHLLLSINIGVPICVRARARNQGLNFSLFSKNLRTLLFAIEGSSSSSRSSIE